MYILLPSSVIQVLKKNICTYFTLFYYLLSTESMQWGLQLHRTDWRKPL